MAAGGHFDEAARHLVPEPRHDAKDAAREHERELVAAHLEPRGDRPRREHELVGGAFENTGRDRVAEIARLLHDRAERRDAHPRQLAVVDDARQARGVVDVEMREDVFGEPGVRPAPIHRAHDRRERFAADPVAAPLVADDVSPAAGARRLEPRVASVHD